mmetsp:Transcript_117202/g.233553  ORF Transcript_117202/g.233553 Transcript_117202/m.233553 type:complete len:286 (+) Transcript_117202:78-935(+)
MSVRVVFEVSCPTSNFEEVCLVGSVPELGAWDSTRAVPLRTSDKMFPVWRSSELVLPKVYEVAQYKYIKVCSGAVAQWELGPHRILELGRLSDNMVNYVGDVAMDSECLGSETLGLAKSQMTSLVTSRPASSIPSPLRTSAGPTPVEKSHMQELEVILRGLVELEPMNLVGRADVRRAIVAVRSAIEAERHGINVGNGGPYHRVQRQCTGRTCAVLSLLMVPLLPIIVATAILWQVPSARHQQAHPVETRNQFRWCWPWGREDPPSAFCCVHRASSRIRALGPRR